MKGFGYIKDEDEDILESGYDIIFRMILMLFFLVNNRIDSYVCVYYIKLIFIFLRLRIGI